MEFKKLVVAYPPENEPVLVTDGHNKYDVAYYVGGFKNSWFKEIAGVIVEFNEFRVSAWASLKDLKSLSEEQENAVFGIIQHLFKEPKKIWHRREVLKLIQDEINF